MARTPTLTMEDMDPEEIDEFMHGMKHTVPGGKYRRNGVWVDANGLPFVTPKQEDEEEDEPKKPSSPKKHQTSEDLDKMSKEQLLTLPEAQTITGADRMSTPDLLRAVTELRNK